MKRYQYRGEKVMHRLGRSYLMLVVLTKTHVLNKTTTRIACDPIWRVRRPELRQW